MNALASQGYQVIPSILSPDDISAMRAAITETIDRVAAALWAPFSMSCPDAAFERCLYAWRSCRLIPRRRRFKPMIKPIPLTAAPPRLSTMTVISQSGRL